MADVSAEHIRIERADAVGRIVLDRPQRNNAMDPETADGLARATVALADDDDVRCLVLTGTGSAFNSGADLSSLSGDPSESDYFRRIVTDLHTAVRALARAPKPVVAAVNGVAAGGGIGPALAADLVVMSDEARFEFAYPRIGLSGDGGSTFFLPRLVGPRRAAEIALFDEPIDAERAVEWGLANECVSADAFEDRVAELATDLAAGPTRAHAATTRLMREGLSRGFDAQLSAEADSLVALAERDDYAAGIRAFHADEEPEFCGE